MSLPFWAEVDTFLPEEEGGKRKDERNLLEEVNSSHVVLTTKEDMFNFNNNKRGKIVGLLLMST